MPCSAAVKRAMKMTEKAFTDLGYECVPFFLTKEVWDEARDLCFGLVANGPAPSAFKELMDSCEVQTDFVKEWSIVYQAGTLMRWFLDKVLLPCTNKKRNAHHIRNMRVMKPKDVERLCKRRDYFIYDVS